MAKAWADALRAPSINVLSAEERDKAIGMLGEDCRARLRAANRRDAAAWAKVRSRADWERFRDERVKALRESLGQFPPIPKTLDVETIGTLEGEGFRIEKLVFESRPGLVVTANLYVPNPARAKMPAFLLVHSHHNPKEQSELQDMGVLWSRLGCLVLVPDQISHGERRQQPFAGREDYRHRMVLGMQLHLVGESLMGWMAWDLLRCVDLLLARPGIDRERVIVIGSVAGGGDPAAVAAALDPRIACAIPFNFGGPQPETIYPLPENAEEAFNFAGSGSFESTRNLRRSARDGFLPYVIVGAAAPRPLLYAHEFAWDAERDPVWKRFGRIWGFYDAADRLAAVHGWGRVTIRPPDASHCNNVGAPHRKGIYPHLERWFGIPAPKEEPQDRRPAEELRCLTDAVAARRQPKLVHYLAKALSLERAGKARAALAPLAPAQRRAKLRADWARLLGDIEPRGIPKAEVRGRDGLAERLLLTLDDGFVVPALLLAPPAEHGAGTPRPQSERLPLVVAVAKHGKAGFLKHRADEIAALLARGVAVCLPDVRSTGETDANGEPGRHRKTVGPSSTYMMLGETLTGLRLRDLRGVLRYLRTRPELDATRLALWGDSFAEPNVPPFADKPLESSDCPRECEPLGGLLALLAALFEDDAKAVLVRRGLASFESLLCSPFVYVPHDIIVPGALTVGDLADVAAALAPLPLRFEGLVDGRNCAVSEPELRRWFEPARQAYAGEEERLMLKPDLAADGSSWLAAALG
ncbi:MAG TPA: acetylxylan esterase [Planctomycetota bacterium]|nr:acetylxylan esterase [Planctomycetota bacterium]HRR80852.1 acetylxylan esterase [Planctomycetota bacterium]HRT95959.1 acetylxylan esterase [Planctomycetota bacterium]